jgi:hypothetical protein
VTSNCQVPGLFVRPHPRTHYRSDSMTIFINGKFECGPWQATPLKTTATVCFAGDFRCIDSAELNTLVNSFRVPNSYNLRIPPYGLSVGTYKFAAQVVLLHSGYNSTVVATLQIIRSPITVLLLPLGVSRIVLGHNEQYTFSPTVSNNGAPFKVNRHLIWLSNSASFHLRT